MNLKAGLARSLASKGQGELSDADASANQRLSYLAAWLALVLWSGTAIANKVAVAHMDALNAGVLRSMLAGFLALTCALVMKLPVPRELRSISLLLVSGVSSFALWPIMLSIGIARTTAGHAALIMALIPVMTVLIDAIFNRSSPQLRWWLGSAVALAGTMALIAGRGGLFQPSVGEATWVGDVLVLAGCLVCASGYVAGGRLSRSLGAMATTFWGLAVALLVLIPAFALRWTETAWTEVPLPGWLAIAWMALCSSFIGYALWFFALARGGISRIGTLQLAMPVMTLFGAALILGEILTPGLLLLSAVIMSGIYLAQQPRTG